MRKKLALLLFGLAALAPAAALSPTAARTPFAPASVNSCPKNTHLFVCPTYSFCCPNNAFCACLP